MILRRKKRNKSYLQNILTTNAIFKFLTFKRTLIFLHSNVLLLLFNKVELLTRERHILGVDRSPNKSAPARSISGVDRNPNSWAVLGWDTFPGHLVFSLTLFTRYLDFFYIRRLYRDTFLSPKIRCKANHHRQM